MADSLKKEEISQQESKMAAEIINRYLTQILVRMAYFTILEREKRVKLMYFSINNLFREMLISRI